VIEDDEALFHAERIGLNTALGVCGLLLPEDAKYFPYLARLADIERLARCDQSKPLRHIRWEPRMRLPGTWGRRLRIG